LIWVLFRIIVTPLYTITFLDIFVADILTSMSTFLVFLYLKQFNIQSLFCLYTLKSDGLGNFCESIYINSLPVLSIIPIYIRMMQCFKRYYDTRNKVHLFNLGKYLTSALTILMQFLLGIIKNRILLLKKRTGIDNSLDCD
jgi:hypothetical protein